MRSEKEAMGPPQDLLAIQLQLPPLYAMWLGGEQNSGDCTSGIMFYAWQTLTAVTQQYTYLLPTEEHKK